MEVFSQLRIPFPENSILYQIEFLKMQKELR